LRRATHPFGMFAVITPMKLPSSGKPSSVPVMPPVTLPGPVL
jgi:hypothetical protein